MEGNVKKVNTPERRTDVNNTEKWLTVKNVKRSS